MWVSREVFFWPIFGDMPTGDAPYWPLAWERALHDPWRWVKEAVGLGYLVWLWFALGLNLAERRFEAINSGRLPEHVAEA